MRKNSKSVSQVSIPCRVCQEGTWNSFWVCKFQDKTYAGIGNSPGQKCVAILKDEADEKNETNASPDKTTEDSGVADKPDSNAAAAETPKPKIQYVGFGNAAQQGRPVKLRNVYVTLVPTLVAEQLEFTSDTVTMDVLMDQQDDIDDEALKEYQDQCRKAKARAEKFGLEYKEPDLAAVVPWSQARKLRANPQKGFITGIDVTDPEELAKQEARKSRFGVVTKKRELEEDEQENEEEATDPVADETNQESIPAIQAWDNEELVRFQRVDPPTNLWKVPPEGVEASENQPPQDEFSMEMDKPTLVPEKIHIFSIDWSAFKQIRSDDLMVCQ